MALLRSKENYGCIQKGYNLKANTLENGVLATGDCN
jgi:hypothetical protein